MGETYFNFHQRWRPPLLHPMQTTRHVRFVIVIDAFVIIIIIIITSFDATTPANVILMVVIAIE